LRRAPLPTPIDAAKLGRYAAALRENGETCVAMFDLGTKAARLLVAPRRKPASWEPHTFLSSSIVPALGEHLDAAHRFNLASPAFNEVVEFVRRSRDGLLAAGVAPADIAATGSAVFRWMANRDAVLAEFKARTGLDVYVLEEREEAYLSLYALASTYPYRARQLPGAIDAFLLLDQGGGSLEVSYFDAGDPALSAPGKMHSFDRLGTVALKERFFRLAGDGADGPLREVEPAANASRVVDQKRRIVEYVAERVRDWEGFPELEGKHVVAYGMGTALTHCFDVSGYQIHNRVLTAAELAAAVERVGRELDARGHEVRALVPKLDRDLREELTIYSGLPAYAGLLEKFGLGEIRVAGYGLRFGAYLWHFVMGRPFAALPVHGAGRA
jgi:exopolyphosphatase/pppGpp-phosphohydrolase